jgi:site-specific DNA recombinase
MRVATYTRISTDEERQPFSLEAQADRLSAYVSTQPGWALARSYTDQMTGKSLERPGLQRALSDARAGRYDLLLVFKVDRLARSTSGLLLVLEELQAAGVAFRSASEPLDTSTAAGRMMLQMLGVFAEFEREMIVERTKMGLAKKAARGEWKGGPSPYGYSYDPERRLLVPIEEEAANVRRIFRLYGDRRLGTMAISKQMNDEGHLTRRRARWTPKKVIDILRNPTYLGRLPFNGEVYKAAHEPLVDEELFHLAGQLLLERGESRALRGRAASDYLVGGLMRCARCGHGFIGTVAHGRNAAYRYYTCFSRLRHGTARCDQDRIPAEPVEDAVISVTLEALREPAFFEECARLARQEWELANPDREKRLARIDHEVAKKRKAIDRYLRAFELGKMSEATCGYRLKELEKEVAALEGQQAGIQAECEEAPDMPTDGLLADLERSIRGAADGDSTQKLKDLLACVVDEIVVESRARIMPYYSLPAVRPLFPSRRRTGIEPACRLSPAHRF